MGCSSAVHGPSGVIPGASSSTGAPSGQQHFGELAYRIADLGHRLEVAHYSAQLRSTAAAASCPETNCQGLSQSARKRTHALLAGGSLYCHCTSLSPSRAQLSSQGQGQGRGRGLGCTKTPPVSNMVITPGGSISITPQYQPSPWPSPAWRRYQNQHSPCSAFRSTCWPSWCHRCKGARTGYATPAEACAWP